MSLTPSPYPSPLQGEGRTPACARFESDLSIQTQFNRRVVF